MAISICFPVHPWCRNTFHDYVVFTKSISFMLGLILSYRLVEKTFLNILITRLTGAWSVYDLRKAVVVVNLQEGTSALLVTFFAYVADVHTGRFKMLVFSTVVCIIGLLLNRLAAGNDDDDDGRLEFGLFYPALGLMTLAQAANTVTLQAFLDDQLTAAAADGNDDTGWRRRSSFWWYFVSFLASFFAQFGPLARLPFGTLALVLMAVMGAGFLLFLLGTKYYNCVARIENPFKDVGSVIYSAITNRKVEHPQIPEESLSNSSGDLHIPPRITWLRWLDRAAIVQETQPGWRSPSCVEQVRRAKLLLKMLPLWSCFLTLSLVAASGSTFFFEEAIILSPNDLFPILLFANLQRYPAT